MPRVEDQAFAQRVYHFYNQIAHKDRKKTVEHFAQEGKTRQSIYKIIRRFEANGTPIYRKIPGRPPVLSATQNVKRIKKLFTKDPNITDKLGMSRQRVNQIKVHTLGIKARVRKPGPKYVGAQEKRAKTALRKIYEKHTGKVLIIDDETYVPYDPEDVPGRKFYNAVHENDVTYDQKYRQKAKFPKRHLVWQAIDEHGNVSRPYFSEGTINSQIYLEECLKKRLIPFIQEHHTIDKVLFWPDMASAHYAKVVTDFLQEKNVIYVSKSDNAPNTPQARGIENFWGICKQKYAERKSKPKSTRGFRQIWTQISNDVAATHGKDIMRRSWKLLREAGRKGIKQATAHTTKK